MNHLVREGRRRCHKAAFKEVQKVPSWRKREDLNFAGGFSTRNESFRESGNPLRMLAFPFFFGGCCLCRSSALFVCSQDIEIFGAEKGRSWRLCQHLFVISWRDDFYQWGNEIIVSFARWQPFWNADERCFLEEEKLRKVFHPRSKRTKTESRGGYRSKIGFNFLLRLCKFLIN